MELTLASGGDTIMKGAVADGQQVTATIGGNLNIESLQDTSKYDSKQQSLGGSVSLCVPPFCYGASSGNVSAGKSNINSDFASVIEQSAIKAGDGGFQIDVKGNAGLKGGIITSTDKAIEDGRNSFQTGGSLTLADIQNQASYDANAAGVNF